VTAGNLSWTYSWVERLGQVGHIAASNGMTTTRDFDAMGRLSGITTRDKDGKIVAQHGYEYDALNRRVRGEREDASRWDYGYDNLGQVTSGVRKTADGASIPGFNFQYGFDNIGNRRNATVNGRTDSYAPTLLNTYTNKTNSGAFDVVGTAEQGTTLTLEGAIPGAPRIPVTRLNNWFAGAAPADNAAGATLGTAELLAIKKNAGPNAADVIEEETRSKVVRPAAEGFTYDLDGNLESDGLWNYGWDGENRLISLTPKTGNENLLGAKFAFGYDGESRRIWTDRTAWDSGNATWSATTERTWFVYDGWNLLCTLEVGGSTLDVGRSLVWGPDLSGTLQGAGGIGGLLFVNFTSNATLSSSPFYDGNGNVLGLLAADGQTVTARYEYGPFGEPLAKTGPAADLNPFRWSSKFTDESGLVYYGYRFYNPETGRWLSRDPIEERGGVNLYGCGFNAPSNFVDILGLEWRKVNCWALNERVSVSGYDVIGATAVIGITGERCDCCNSDTGEYVEGDAWSSIVEIKGSVGLGVGGEIVVGGFKIGTGQLRGPQLEALHIRGGYSKKCREDGTYTVQKRYALDLSIRASIATPTGVGLVLKGGVNFYGGLGVDFVGANWESYLTYGYTASGMVEGNLIVANVQRNFYGKQGERRIRISSGTF
jgi:RHS repeat-associated protein